MGLPTAFLKKAAGFALKRAPIIGALGTAYDLFNPTNTANEDQLRAQGVLPTWGTPNGGGAPQQAGPAASPNADTNTYGDGSGGGGSAYDPNVDPNLVNKGRGEVGARISAANAVIQALFGEVDRLAGDKMNTLEANYAKQNQDLTSGYEKGATQLQGIYSARNTANSSYYDNAQTDAATAYHSGQDQLNTGRDQNRADIGKFVQTTKAGFDAARPNINLNDISTVSDAMAVRNQLDQLIGNLHTQEAGLGTNSDYAKSLNAVSPTQQTGSDQLAAQLQKLVQSSAPNFAKAEIAKGYIKAAQLQGKEAEDYWLNYFNTLLNPATATTPTVPQQVA